MSSSVKHFKNIGMGAFTVKQQKAIEQLSAIIPESYDAVADKVGCTRTTLDKWRNRPDFKQAIEDTKKSVNLLFLGEQRDRAATLIPLVFDCLQRAVTVEKPTPQSIRACGMALQLVGLLSPMRGPQAQAPQQQPDVTPTMGAIPIEYEEVGLDSSGKVVPISSACPLTAHAQGA